MSHWFQEKYCVGLHASVTGMCTFFCNALYQFTRWPTPILTASLFARLKGVGDRFRFPTRMYLLWVIYSYMGLGSRSIMISFFPRNSPGVNRQLGDLSQDANWGAVDDYRDKGFRDKALDSRPHVQPSKHLSLRYPDPMQIGFRGVGFSGLWTVLGT